METDTITCFEPAININLITSDNTSASWTGPAAFVSDVLQPLINEAGFYDVTVVDTFSQCQESGTVFIQADTLLPQFTITDGELNCGDSILNLSPLSVNENWEYFWSDENGLTQNLPTIEVGIPGTYYLEVEGENGCRNLDSLVISANDSIPNLVVTADILNCLSPLANVNVSSNLLGNIYSWINPMGDTIVGSDFMTSESGIYEVTALH